MNRVQSAKKSIALDQLGFISVCLLAFSLPFELARPIALIGPLIISNVEIVLYAVLAFWLLSRIGTRRICWTRVHSAVLAWILTLILSAIFAPSNQTEALKFTLRSIGGCLLFFSTVDLVKTNKQVSWIAAALAIGSCLSALSGIAEVQSAAVSQFLTAFKTQPSILSGLVRAAGTFEYANIAAMYWEATLVATLGVSLWLTAQRGQMRWQYLGTAASIGIAVAIVLSYSRAALIGSILELIILLAISHQTRSVSQRPIVIALIALIGTAAIMLFTNPLFALRLKSETNLDWYLAEYQAINPPSTLEPNHSISVTVQITNRSIQEWPNNGERAIYFGYHWLDDKQQIIIQHDSPHTPLPYAVAQDSVVTVVLRITAPVEPSTYFLQWDLLQENVTWFSSVTGQASGLLVSVTANGVAQQPPTVISQPAAGYPLGKALPPRSDLWRVAFQMWREHPILGIGPDNFRHLYGSYLGLSIFNDTVTTNSLYIEILTNVGMLGLASFLAILCAAFTFIRRTWHTLTEPANRWLAASLWLAFAAFLIHGLVDTFLAFTPTYGLFWLVCGLLVSVLNESDRHDTV
ncbi:MAG TPA: O-antigen ligase family protein [Anaerolineae bacterium]|nr:O-antigen ligase family protein [Anaerolineae bacterium]